VSADWEDATCDLCRRIAAIGFDDLSSLAIERARQLFLDGIAVALAGTAHEEPPEILAAHARDMGGTETSTVIGFGFKTSPVQAAYVNGSSMHVLDYEPMWSPANHQLSTSLPALLALAEQRDADGAALVTALVKGIELMGWLRVASGELTPQSMSFHGPGLVGPLGAAVAAGHMIGLDAGQLQNAIGIAASRCGSLLGNVGTATKSTHCGLATAQGLEAALLAERGFTANPDILEHRQGYAELYFGRDTFDFAALQGYGPPFRIVDPGYAIKMFPSQFGTHFAITAALELRKQIADPARITAVHLTGPVMTYIDRPNPATGLDGKFSWQYTTATALLDGRVGIDSFTDAKRFSPAMQTLLGMVTVSMSEDIPAAFEDCYVDLEIDLVGGETLKTRCHGPRGIWGTPPISTDEHLIKVRDCLAAKLDSDGVERIVELGSRIEQLDPGELGEVIRLAGCF